MLLFQIMVNIGMVTGIMPVTGIPLPFMTYGGSIMIALLFGMGHPAVGPDARSQARAVKHRSRVDRCDRAAYTSGGYKPDGIPETRPMHHRRPKSHDWPKNRIDGTIVSP